MVGADVRFGAHGPHMMMILQPLGVHGGMQIEYMLDDKKKNTKYI